MTEGTQVGAYRLLKPIGEGGMGSVWLAEHIALGRRAALKMLHPEFSTRPDIVTRFFNEARAATSIVDPGIVQIFDFGQHLDGSAYIVMELLDGEPLDRRLKREGALSLADGLRLMRQVASTLGAAHARGIIHRDLKPENIFIVRDPEVPGGERAKVLDFGIAKLAGDHVGVKTQTAAMIGTPMFMSPEQCRGAGQVDQRSDVYALGCVLFTLVVGRPPFNAEGIGDIIAMHLREPAPAPSQLRPGLPPEIDQLVLRCLAKDPAQRFPTAGELAMADRVVASGRGCTHGWLCIGDGADHAVGGCRRKRGTAGEAITGRTEGGVRGRRGCRRCHRTDRGSRRPPGGSGGSASRTRGSPTACAGPALALRVGSGPAARAAAGPTARVPAGPATRVCIAATARAARAGGPGRADRQGRARPLRRMGARSPGRPVSRRRDPRRVRRSVGPSARDHVHGSARRSDCRRDLGRVRR